MGEFCMGCIHALSECSPRCPAVSSPPAVFICSGCGHDIFEGEDYWDVLDEQFCETCIDNARKVAEYEPY